MDIEKIYLFVYGSLINKLSRRNTIGRDVPFIKVNLKKEAGFTCDWCFRSEKHKMTALGIYKSEAKKDISGLILEVKPDDFIELDKREIGYNKIKIEKVYFNRSIKDCNILLNEKIKYIYTYVVNNPLLPNEEFPIKSYYLQLCGF